MTSLTKRSAFLGEFAASASAPSAIRGRISLIGAERNIPQQEIDQALAEAGCRFLELDGALLRLCDRYSISLHWLITGDLHCLKLMRRPPELW